MYGWMCKGWRYAQANRAREDLRRGCTDVPSWRSDHDRRSGLHAATAATAQEAGRQRTVWDGVHREKQAQRGAAAYQQLCSRSHRENLEGTAEAPSLIGGPFFDRWTYLSVHDLFFAIQITMSQLR